jgi:hypothetical protein
VRREDIGKVQRRVQKAEKLRQAVTTGSVPYLPIQ